MNVKSLRFRMTCWYVLALAVTFVASGLIVYRLAGRTLHADLDNLLELRAEGVAASIETFWAVESEATARDGRVLGTRSKVGNLGFRNLAQRWVEERIKDPVLLEIVVQVFGPEGELIASSRSLPGATLLPFEALAPVLPPSVRFLNVVSEGEPGERRRFRALSLPVRENGRLAYVIRVLGPLDTVEGPLRALRLILLLVLPLAMALSGVAGGWLAGRTLRPVGRMVDSARIISSESLHVRLPRPGTRDELDRLAATFNGMLDRIERGFSFQRQFWEDVAHELKTPLAIMKGEIEVALRSGGGPEDREVLASCLEEVDGLIRLIEKMLTLARLDRGGAAAAQERLDLADLTRRAVEEFRDAAEGKGLRLDFAAAAGATAGSAVPVLGDEVRLRGLVYILLDNAVKFTPAGGAIAVEVGTEDGRQARLAVADTGPGIGEDDLPHVFERFRRAGSPAAGGGGGGFGLGLSIAKAVAEAHGGRIEVRSRVGAGTTFIVHLPLA